LDFFNDLPSDFKNVNLTFTGREMVGKHYEEVKESIVKQKKQQAKGNKSSLKMSANNISAL
jgi:hypothetical protein